MTFSTNPTVVTRSRRQTIFIFALSTSWLCVESGLQGSNTVRKDVHFGTFCRQPEISAVGGALAKGSCDDLLAVLGLGQESGDWRNWPVRTQHPQISNLSPGISRQVDRHPRQ
ncbi:predicted protein [Histoplasma capsulatum G186AR]|uniref:Uncharacterized protein n=1 Tax=Ajellomyces capsulatus (strain G186AR / H82 / ATCC MYA-2454 / RMSCC 2432) TaxID=447093 RepID=C0NUC7_AJECG|nr:uncharacterized protein HCBG_06958 [Histoplasma capsulatum G186AR]EEH05007.1 predicted protein [Histoplasma capsulatum G186AR]